MKNKIFIYIKIIVIPLIIKLNKIDSIFIFVNIINNFDKFIFEHF